MNTEIIENRRKAGIKSFLVDKPLWVIYLYVGFGVIPYSLYVFGVKILQAFIEIGEDDKGYVSYF